jgi:hypothetical protein
MTWSFRNINVFLFCLVVPTVFPSVILSELRSGAELSTRCNIGWIQTRTRQPGASHIPGSFMTGRRVVERSQNQGLGAVEISMPSRLLNYRPPQSPETHSSTICGFMQETRQDKLDLANHVCPCYD